jgi:hypothetical protein
MQIDKEVLEAFLESIEQIKVKQETTQSQIQNVSRDLMDRMNQNNVEVLERINKSTIENVTKISEIELAVEKRMNSIKNGIILSIDRYKKNVTADIKTFDDRIDDVESEISLLKQKIAIIVGAITVGVNLIGLMLNIFLR